MKSPKGEGNTKEFVAMLTGLLARFGWTKETVGTRKRWFGNPQHECHVFTLLPNRLWLHRAYAMDVAYGYGVKSLEKHLTKFQKGVDDGLDRGDVGGAPAGSVRAVEEGEGRDRRAV